MFSPAVPDPSIEKIAVLRANGLGDYLFAVPALEALRASYPGADIVLLGKPWHADLLTGRPGPVDRVVVVPLYAGVSADEGFENDPDEVDRFFDTMGNEAFDLALQVHGGGRHSNPFARRLGARLTVGLQARGAPPLDRSVPYVYFQSEVLRYLEVASLAGAPPTTIEPRLQLVETDRREARSVLPDDSRPLAVLHPGVGDTQRQWPVEKFAAVGDALAAAGARVAVTGTASERHLVEGVVEAMAGEGEDLCALLSLGGLAAVLARAQVVVANDSGPLHLAAAVGSRTVGIYSCFNLITAGVTTRSRHRPIISWRLQCPMCGVNRTERECDHRPSFVADVPAGAVTAAALELFRSEL